MSKNVKMILPNWWLISEESLVGFWCSQYRNKNWWNKQKLNYCAFTGHGYAQGN